MVSSPPCARALNALRVETASPNPSPPNPHAFVARPPAYTTATGWLHTHVTHPPTPHLPHLQAPRTPAERNRTPDEAITQRIELVVAAAGGAVGSGLGRLAPFMTNALLDRVERACHGLSLEQRGGMPKQVAVATVVADLTGVRIPARAEAEHQGNATTRCPLI